MNYTEGRDAILGVINTAWAAEYPDYPINFPDVVAEKPETTDGADTPWARAGVTHTNGGQASLAGDVGQRRWRRVGFLWVQVFTPIGDGGTRSDEIAQVLVDALQTQRSAEGVWFRNPRMRDVTTPSGAAFKQTNVLCDFSYDDVR